MQQVPEEFTKYCIFLADLKVKDALDIGVYRGRSAYFICAVLMRNNPKLQYEMVDIDDKLDHFEEYSEVLPALHRGIPKTSAEYRGKAYDYVFIDAEHTYDAAIVDYENVGKYANVLMGFHDIYAHEYDSYNGGTVRLWNEVLKRESGNEYKTFSEYPNRWMGIGCILKKKG